MTTKTKTKTPAAKTRVRAARKPPRSGGNSRQFVVDEKGRRTAVLLPIRQYRKLLDALEDLEDIRAADEARAEGGEPIPWEQVKAELRAQGKLP